jgi:hypothetical protein
MECQHPQASFHQFSWGNISHHLATKGECIKRAVQPVDKIINEQLGISTNDCLWSGNRVAPMEQMIFQQEKEVHQSHWHFALLVVMLLQSFNGCPGNWHWTPPLSTSLKGNKPPPACQSQKAVTALA